MSAIEVCSACGESKELVLSQRHFKSGIWLGFCNECYESICEEKKRFCRLAGEKYGRKLGALQELRKVENEMNKYFSGAFAKQYVKKRIKELEGFGGLK